MDREDRGITSRSGSTGVNNEQGGVELQVVQESIDDHNCKPTDRGQDAWTILLVAFTFEALFWGFPNCFGVFENYYTQGPFKQDSNLVPLVGTLAQSLYFVGAPFSAMLTRLLPKYQRQQVWFGWLCCILGLLTASFAGSVSALICTQGVLYGFGFVTLTYPIISMLDEWWILRKGMAFGVLSAASGATGAVMPFTIETCLSRYGFRTTLRGCAVGMSILTAPLIPLLKPRHEATLQRDHGRTNWGFLRNMSFWVYTLAFMTQGLGFFYPPVFLPSYASIFGIPSIQGALLLAAMAMAQVVGQFVFGTLSDRHPVSLLTTIACSSTTVAVFVFWGLGKSVGLLVVFSILFGFFAYGFSTMRLAMARVVSDDPSSIFAAYTIFSCVRGVGNLLVGPISSALLDGRMVNLQRYAAGKYDSIVLLTGLTSLLAAIPITFYAGGRALSNSYRAACVVVRILLIRGPHT